MKKLEVEELAERIKILFAFCAEMIPNIEYLEEALK